MKKKKKKKIFKKKKKKKIFFFISLKIPVNLFDGQADFSLMAVKSFILPIVNREFFEGILDL